MSQDKINGKVTDIEFQMMIDEAKRTLPMQIQAYIVDSEIMFERFQALKTAGFSEQEALEIIKARGVTL